jgi:hypothetical protein
VDGLRVCGHLSGGMVRVREVAIFPS